jgi:hypothetical protein
MVVSPNPASQTIQISYSSDISEVKILDIAGKQHLLIEGGFDNIDISQLDNGVYIVKLITVNGDISSHKIIKIQ